MSRKGLVFHLLLVFILVSAKVWLWLGWGKVICGLAGGLNFRWNLAVFFVLAWGTYLAVLSIFSVLAANTKWLVGGWLAGLMSLIFVFQRAGVSLDWSLAITVVLSLGEIIFILGLKKDLKNHIKFVSGHLLSPGFRSIRIFLITSLSMYLIWASTALMADFSLTIPDFAIEALQGFIPTGNDQVKGVESSAALSTLEKFLSGEEALPEEYRQYLEQDNLPPEVEQSLRQQGIPLDLAKSFLSTIEIDEEGKIKEPIQGGTEDLVIQGLKPMLEDQINQLIEPYRKYLPLAFGVSGLVSLLYLSMVVDVFALILFQVVLCMLKWTRVVTVKTETVEAERLIV